MINIFLIPFFLFCPASLYESQGLSIELSIEWRKHQSYLNIPPLQPGDSIDLPILKITYRNLTSEDIYFVKVTSTKSGFPSIKPASIYNTELDMADQVKYYENYYNESFEVEINEVWEVKEVGCDKSIEKEIHIVNDFLWRFSVVSDLQEAINHADLDYQLACFSYPNREVISYRRGRSLFPEDRRRDTILNRMDDPSINRNEIKGRLNDKFVFLKAGETYCQEMNLIGFYLLGGQYFFSIAQDSLPDFLGDSFSNKRVLPKFVDSYRLYEGFFQRNMVGVVFNKCN